MPPGGWARRSVVVAIAARAGSEPRLAARRLIGPIAIFLGAMAVSALIAGIIGFTLARQDRIGLVGELAANVPAERHDRFLAAWWAHTASYAAGALGGVAVAVWALVHRLRRPA